MARIYKESCYLVDDEEIISESEVKYLIDHTLADYGIVHQLHVETSEHFTLEDNDPECFENCDLADLEKHFNHGNVAGDVVVGGVYKHFKGHEVKVIAVSIGTEYGEKVVVYEHLGDHTVWHRPIGMFCSEVDHEKYPDVKQKRRFELVRW